MLEICSSFFGRLDTNAVRYCHWKSNIRLAKALDGRTDLDILVHVQDRDRFENALRECGFKEVLSPPSKRYPGMEDYLGFDHQTGRLVHLHVHYRLILGQKFIKNHHLPIEELFFRNLVLDGQVSIPCPELELMILIIRAHMKTDLVSLAKHAVKDVLGKWYSPFPADIDEELAFLMQRCDVRKFRDLLRQSALPIREDLFLDFMARFSEHRLRCIDVIRTMRAIFSSLRGYRRRRGLLVHLDYLRHYLAQFPWVRSMRPSKQKTLPVRGKVFSLVGADGSGKSTLLKDLVKWLSWKLSVRVYYYGIPKTSFIRVVSFLAYACRKLRLNRISSSVEGCLWVYISRQRYAIFKTTRDDIEQGRVIITDRFPLREFHAMQEPMDGPRLRGSGAGIGALLSEAEDRYYRMIEYPDRVIVLKADFDVIRGRKSDLDQDTHKAKVAAVNALEETDRMTLIDANEPYDTVLLEVKRLIWSLL